MIRFIPKSQSQSQPLLDIIGDFLREHICSPISKKTPQKVRVWCEKGWDEMGWDGEKNSQTTLCGLPGGKKGNAEESTTRKPLTPKTLACESTTARGSLERPILPGGGLISNQEKVVREGVIWWGRKGKRGKKVHKLTSRTRMMQRREHRSDKFQDLSIGLDGGSGGELLRDDARQVRDLPQALESLHGELLVRARGQPGRVHDGVIRCGGRVDGDGAARGEGVEPCGDGDVVPGIIYRDSACADGEEFEFGPVGGVAGEVGEGLVAEVGAKVLGQFFPAWIFWEPG